VVDGSERGQQGASGSMAWSWKCAGEPGEC